MRVTLVTLHLPNENTSSHHSSLIPSVIQRFSFVSVGSLMLGLARSIAVRKLVPASSRPFHSSIFWGAKSLRPFLLADIGEGITGKPSPEQGCAVHPPLITFARAVECEVLKWSVFNSRSPWSQVYPILAHLSF